MVKFLTTIIWHGHACFEIVSSDGLRIVFDPHDGRSIGIKQPDTKADIVLISHDHFDHNAAEVVAKPDAMIFKMKKGVFEAKGARIEGIEEYHDKEGGRLRGKTMIYLLEVDDLVFAHLGDLGRIPPPNVVEKLRRADIVFVPVGGTFTIGPREALEIAEKVKPRILVPMHYWVPGIMLPLATLDEFLAIAKWPTVRLETNQYTVSKEELPEKNTIVVFRHP